MKIRKVLSVLLVCLFAVGCMGGNAAAADRGARKKAGAEIIRASGEFRMSVTGKSTAAADSSFPLEAGETVTVKASYSPFYAKVDCGLIAPDGTFYYETYSNGTIDLTIEIEERGNYTLTICNNSSVTVSVSGFVNY